MPQFPALSGEKLVRALGKIGYRVVRERGSHMRLACSGRKSVTVPDYSTISKGLVRKILRDAKLSVEELVKLL